MAGKSGRNISNIPENSLKKNLLSWEGMLVIILLAVFIGFSAVVPTFNLTSILSQQKYLDELIILFPMAFVLILGEIDISVGSIVCLAGTCAAIVSNGGMSSPASIVIGILVGLLCGVINGLICIIFTELPPMIITLGTQILFRGIAEILLGSGGSISIADSTFGVLAGKIGIFPITFILFILFAVASTILAHKTTFGRRVFAIGSNRLTSFYSGINVPMIRLFVYAWLGLAAGICAMLLNAYSFGVNTTTGQGYEMDVIAMAVFGGISNIGGKGKLIGGIISALTIVCLQVGLGLMNMNGQIIKIVLGVLLVLAVLLPNVVGMINTKRKMIKK